MRLEVWSDVVCPWCYIGKRRLERALEQWRDAGGEDVEVVWRPFQLDPDAPNDAMPVPQALAEKFGGGARQAITHVTRVAAEEGLEYRMDQAVRANTFAAHQVIAFAYRQGGAELQGAVKERLLRAHFCEGANLGDSAVLDKLAAEAGLEGVGAVLDEGTLEKEVRAELAEGLTIGVRSVPTFVVGRRAVAGAQEPEVLLTLLREGEGSRK
ncbi:MAG TPA: DsbA family oxidoreductase [Pseudonocardiaceae bacterium]